MIHSTALLQALSGSPAGTLSSAGATGVSPNASGVDFAQELQRMTQANAMSERQATPPASAQLAPPQREPSPARTRSSDDAAKAPEDEDTAAAHAEAETTPETAEPAPARKPAMPRKTRSEGGEDTKDRKAADVASPAESTEEHDSTEPGTSRIRVRKFGAAAADGAMEPGAIGLAGPAVTPLHKLGRSEAGDTEGLAGQNLPGAASPVTDPLQATAQAAAVRRALMGSGETSGSAALQAAAVQEGVITDAAEAGAIGLEGLAPVLSTATSPLGPTVAAGLAAESRINPSASPDAGAAAATRPRTEDVDGEVGTPLFGQSLGARISLLARDGIEQARLNVHPADMGPIAVRLALDGNQVRVDLSAELGSTRQALEQSLPALATALQDAGFTLAGGGVFQQARDNPQPQRQEGSNGTGPDGRSVIDPRGTDSERSIRAPATQGLVDLFA